MKQGPLTATTVQEERSKSAEILYEGPCDPHQKRRIGLMCLKIVVRSPKQSEGAIQSSHVLLSNRVEELGSVRKLDILFLQDASPGTKPNPSKFEGPISCLGPIGNTHAAQSTKVSNSNNLGSVGVLMDPSIEILTTIARIPVLTMPHGTYCPRPA